MRKGIIGLTFFFFLMIGVTAVSAKLAQVHLYTPTLVHDKPTTCSECFKFMWSGPEAHQCTQAQIKKRQLKTDASFKGALSPHF